MFEMRPYRRNSMSTWNPFSEMEEMERRLFNNDFFSGRGLAEFKTDITDEGDYYELKADLPGFKKEDIQLQLDGDTLTIKRMLEDGYMTIKVQTPCLITCIKELNNPRYMSIGGIYDTYNKPLETYDYEKLKDHPLIDATTIGLKGSPTNIFKSFTPPQKGAGMMLEGADKATCEKLADILAKKHII